MPLPPLRPICAYLSFPTFLPALPPGPVRLIPHQTRSGLVFALAGGNGFYTIHPDSREPTKATWQSRPHIIPGADAAEVYAPYNCHLRSERQLVAACHRGVAFWDTSLEAWELTAFVPGEPVSAICQIQPGNINTKLAVATPSGLMVWSLSTGRALIEGVSGRSTPKIKGRIHCMAMLKGKLSNVLAVAVDDRLDLLDLDDGNVTTLFSVSDNQAANVSDIFVSMDRVLFSGGFSSFQPTGGAKVNARRLLLFDINLGQLSAHQSGSIGRLAQAALLQSGWDISVGSGVLSAGGGLGLYENGLVRTVGIRIGDGRALAVVGSTALFAQNDGDGNGGECTALGQIKLVRAKN